MPKSSVLLGGKYDGELICATEAENEFVVRPMRSRTQDRYTRRVLTIGLYTFMVHALDSMKDSEVRDEIIRAISTSTNARNSK